MEISKLYRMIHLQPEIIEKLEMCERELDLSELDAYLKRMINMETAKEAYRGLKEYFGEDKGNIKMLYCQLECARRMYDKYQEKKIPDNIFIDTMKCYSRFIDECKEKNGWMFFDRGWWTYRQLSMEIFRIGDLEYQFIKHGNEDAMAIHIPSDAVFTREAVNDSLQLAEEFFDTYYPEYKYKKYTCESWLLSQELKKFLTAESKILDFQNRFEILEESKDKTEFIEWLFQRLESTEYKELPEKTSLQRKVKRHLLKGGKIGEAYGIFER